MRVCDVPEEDLCVGMRVASAKDPSHHGTISCVRSRYKDGSDKEIEIYWDRRDWPSVDWAYVSTLELV